MAGPKAGAKPKRATAGKPAEKTKRQGASGKANKAHNARGKTAKTTGQPAKRTTAPPQPPEASPQATSAPPVVPRGWTPVGAAPEPAWTVVEPGANDASAASPWPDPAPRMAGNPVRPGADFRSVEPKGRDPAASRAGWFGDALAITVSILLILDLLALGFLLVNNLYAGSVLLFAPDSQQAEELRRTFEETSARDIALNSLATLVMFGLIPFLWVLGTRVKAWEGTRAYLRLNGRWKDVLKGVLLTLPLLIAVSLLIVLYVLATEGPDALTGTSDEENPAVDAIVEHISLPLALVVSLCAGVGEELMFRGVLQRRLGVWGQAILFGLAHAAGGYLPQIVFAAGLGVLFGYLVQRGWPLWSLMITHFLYDFVLLSSALYLPEGVVRWVA